MKIEGHLYQSVEQAAFCTSIEHEYQQLSLDNKKTRLCTRNSLPTFPQEFGNARGESGWWHILLFTLCTYSSKG